MNSDHSADILAAPARTSAARRGLAIAAGALVVAASAQVTVPVPLSPVPMTLQPLAVLVVGGLLGAVNGAGALMLYVALGMLGPAGVRGRQRRDRASARTHRRLPAGVPGGRGGRGPVRGEHRRAWCRCCWAARSPWR